MKGETVNEVKYSKERSIGPLMKVKCDVPVTSMGIRKRTKWGRYIVLKGTSES